MDSEHKARILIVDDEPELRELLADALQSQGCDISTVGSGTEAIETATLRKPDILITDLRLGDCSGLDVIDRLRQAQRDLPAVVITGHGDPSTLTEASTRRPVELMTKPLDLHRLRNTIREELRRVAMRQRARHRARRLRDIARSTHNQQRAAESVLRNQCATVTAEYRNLAEQLDTQQTIIRYQIEMIAAKNDDDVFRSFFRTFVRNRGAINGIGLVCDANAELRIIGRFGVPKPDTLEFCKHLSDPLIDVLLANPVVQTIDTGEEMDVYDTSIRRYLPGLTAMAIPLIPAPGEMIGMVVLYRKGEQPILKLDEDMAELIAFPTAVAVRRND